MVENSPEELEGTNEEELNSINPLNEEGEPIDESVEPDGGTTEVEPDPEPTEPEPEESGTGGIDEPVGGNESESGIEQTKIRRNKKMKYGLKEVADVIFFDIATDRPVLVFDTSK